MPLEMKVLLPESRQPPSLVGTARVRVPARSLPAPGSVIAMASTASPDTAFGSQRAFCSAVP